MPDMITTAIVVAGESTAAEAHEFLAAVTSATDAPVNVVPLIDAPGAVILHALPESSPQPLDALTLVLFCGHVVRDYDGRLFFTSRAGEQPTPLTAVPIDAVRDVIRSSRQPIVVIFDCTFADDDRPGTSGDRLVSLEQSFAGLAVGVMVSNARSLGLDGGLTRRLAEGIAGRDADLDRDGTITLDELFSYARRRIEQVGIPSHCIVSSTRARGMAVVRFRDRNLFDDDVQFSVYRPRAVQPSVEYKMLVFAHKADLVEDPVRGWIDQTEEVRRRADALASEGVAYGEKGSDSTAPIGRGAILRFVPYVEGIEFDPPDQAFRWRGEVYEAQFRLRASPAVEGRHARGQLSVFYDAVLIADISLTIRVDDVATAPASTLASSSALSDLDRPVPERARPYRKIFVSYSHRDLAVVEQVAAIEHLIGDEFVRDSNRLRAGEEWDARLLELIAQADVFQLFWSRNSMYSANVQREWDYALSLQRPSFVRPVYWEEPLPSDEELPPPELRRLHFQRVDFRSLPPIAVPPVATAPPSFTPPPAARRPPVPPPPASPPPASPPPASPSPSPGRPPRPPRKHRLVRTIAAVGTAALGAAAVLGALATSGGNSSRPGPTTTAPVAVTTTSFAATGDVRLSAACTRGPDRFAIAIETPSSGVDPVVTAILSVDGGPDLRVPLVRTSGNVTAPPGIGLFAGEIAPFDQAGALHWGVQLSVPVAVRSVAIQCGKTVQVLSH